MKLKNAWWLLATMGLGAIVAANATGCGPDDGTAGSGGDGGKGSSSSSSSSSTSSSTGMPMIIGDFLGSPCSADTDCVEKDFKGVCVKSTDNDPNLGGGPANGFCTAPCSTNKDCPGIANLCAKGSGATGQCVLGCERGPDLTYINDPLDEFKCHGREDVACTPLDQSGATFGCLPACGNDSQCPQGRKCDISIGVCVDTPKTGTAMGQLCDLNAATDECAGVCLNVGLANNMGMCSGLCVMGGDFMKNPDCGGLDKGLCVFSAMGSGAGDIGFCAGGCKAHEDCGLPELYCFAITSLNKNNGYCLTADPCTTDADCASNLGKKCTDVPGSGKLCLSPDYPVPGGMDGGADSGSDAGDGGP